MQEQIQHHQEPIAVPIRKVALLYSPGLTSMGLQAVHQLWYASSRTTTPSTLLLAGFPRSWLMGHPGQHLFRDSARLLAATDHLLSSLPDAHHRTNTAAVLCTLTTSYCRPPVDQQSIHCIPSQPITMMHTNNHVKPRHPGAMPVAQC